MIAYEDGVGALAWLARAFGFVEKLRAQAPDGRLTHAEMETGRGRIMLATPTPDYRGPRRHAAECKQAEQWSRVPWVIDGVLVHVDDIEPHYQRAKKEGATMLSPIEGGSAGRRYRAADIEGHRWMFLEAPAAP